MVKINKKVEKEKQELSLNENVLVVFGPGGNVDGFLKKFGDGIYTRMAAGLGLLNLPLSIDYWASWTKFTDLDPSKEIERSAKNTGFIKICYFPDDDSEIKALTPYKGGDLTYAVVVGLSLGFEKIIVVGSDLTGDEERFREGWIKAKDHFNGKVKGFMGFPGELLGEPTQEWLDS